MDKLNSWGVGILFLIMVVCTMSLNDDLERSQARQSELDADKIRLAKEYAEMVSRKEQCETFNCVIDIESY